MHHFGVGYYSASTTRRSNLRTAFDRIIQDKVKIAMLDMVLPSGTAFLFLWINRRVIELFCEQVFGIRKGQAI